MTKFFSLFLDFIDSSPSLLMTNGIPNLITGHVQFLESGYVEMINERIDTLIDNKQLSGGYHNLSRDGSNGNGTIISNSIYLSIENRRSYPNRKK